MDSAGLGNSLGGTLSLGDNSEAGSKGEPVQISRRPMRPQSQSCLPSIDEVDSPIKPPVVQIEQVDLREKSVAVVVPDVDVTMQVVHYLNHAATNVAAPVVDYIEVNSQVSPANANTEKQLEERIKQLKDEAQDFERLQKLKMEAAALERLKKIREEAAIFGSDMEAGNLSDLPRAVVKVPLPPPLPLIDGTTSTKRKTRSELAAEAKQADESKKKNKKPRKNRRV